MIIPSSAAAVTTEPYISVTAVGEFEVEVRERSLTLGISLVSPVLQPLTFTLESFTKFCNFLHELITECLVSTSHPLEFKH